MHDYAIGPVLINPSVNNSSNKGAKLSLADQSSFLEDGCKPATLTSAVQNLKRDIREANKKNKMLKFLRKKAADRKKMKQLEKDPSGAYSSGPKGLKRPKPILDPRKGKAPRRQNLLVLEEKKRQFNSRKKRKVTCRLIYEFISVVFQSLVSIFACVVYIVSLYRKDEGDTRESTFG